MFIDQQVLSLIWPKLLLINIKYFMDYTSIVRQKNMPSIDEWV